jgi:hypothetical protein
MAAGGGLTLGLGQRGLDRHGPKLVTQAVREWEELATSTEQAPFDLAAQAVTKLYRVAGQGVPDVVPAASPAKAAQMLDQVNTLDRVAGPEGRLLDPVLGRLAPRKARRGIGHRLWLDPWKLPGDHLIPAALREEIRQAMARDTWPSRLEQEGQAVWAAAGGPDLDCLTAWGMAEQAILWQVATAVGGNGDPVIEAALAAMRLAGWIVPLEGLAIVVERPSDVRRGRDGNLAQWHRAQMPTQAAVWWRDGAVAEFFDGKPVPPGLWDWPPAQVFATRDPDLIRWAWIDRGTDGMLAGRPPDATAPDPANPGEVIELHHVSRPKLDRLIPGTFIVVANATARPDGTRATHAIEVAPGTTDPVAAVAATFGLGKSVYTRLARAT